MHSIAGVVIHGTNLLSRNLAAYVHVIGIPAAGVSQAGQLFKQACGGLCGCCVRVSLWSVCNGCRWWFVLLSARVVADRCAPPRLSPLM